MLTWIRKLVHTVSSSKGAKVTFAIWMIALIGLSFFAPSAKDYKVNNTEGSVNEDTPSEIAMQKKKAAFPADDGLTALIVFHDEAGLIKKDIEEIEAFSEWLTSKEKPEGIASALPFHQFPPEVQAQTISEDKSTLLFNVSLKEGLDSNDTQIVLDRLTNKWEEIGTNDLQFEITGPAGITADTLSLFKSADFVLMFATIALIFVILIIIYRSPLLAIMPLVIAGIVYGVVDRILGLFGLFEVFSIESQAVSIMLILLFAVITDYSLFIFSRYREELHRYESKYNAMRKAMHHVSEPIFYSGGTVIFAMITLFAAIFKPYHYFAPVFTIAVVVIWMAGLTLIPALFALMGRKAFWPTIPKAALKEKEGKQHFWSWVGRHVVKHPRAITSIVTIFLLIGIINVFSIQFSFNLLKSFPEDISSRVGFQLLEEHYPPGELAPVTVLLEAGKKVDEEFLADVQQLQATLSDYDGIDTVKSKLLTDMITGNKDLPRNFLSKDERFVQFDVILKHHPYEKDALSAIDQIRDDEDVLLEPFNDSVTLYMSGQTANQLDINKMNNRDMIILFSFVIILLTVLLGFQTKSITLPLFMMGTIIVSYVAVLGFSWLIFHYILDYSAISYRLPVYTFIFMVALGIDYNIMLISRIKEFAENHPWKEAVRKGVTYTGGVISSAGIILAATFSVLMTQPIQELFLFGFMMALGILFDTFIIRGLFLPAILMLVHRKRRQQHQ